MFTSQPASHSKRRPPNTFSRPQTPSQSSQNNRTVAGVSDFSDTGQLQPLHDDSNNSQPSVKGPASSTSTSTSRLTPAVERSRTSAHSIPVSYAYGAPSAAKGSPPSRNSTPRGPARRSASQAGETDDGNSIRSGTSTAVAGVESGRAKEPALVRYAKIKQRNKDLGRPFESPSNPADLSQNGNSIFLAGEMGQKSARPIAGRLAGQNLNGSGITDTSVNIATAFSQYLADSGTQNGSGSKKKEELLVESEGEASGSGKETQHVENARSLNAKKRKNRKTEDATYKQGAKESDSESENEGPNVIHGKVKRARVDATTEATEESRMREGSGTPVPAQGPSKKTTSPKRRSADATYRPEPSSSHASSDESSEDRTRRRKSKGKGRASTSGAGAIPIGRRDSDVWYGKKRKGKKGRKGSVLAGGEEEEGSDGSGEDEAEPSEFVGEGGQIDMGGFEYEGEDTQDGPAASYYLRAKSLSPDNTSQSPFDPETTKREQSIDPTFAAFDQSMNSSFGGRERSYDESGVQNSSYDYSEEERIVAAIEAQKNVAQNSSPARSQRQVNGNGRTGNVSGTPSGLRQRKNRVPSPPALNRVAEEPEESEESGPAKDGSDLGQRLGETARPVIELGKKGWNKLQDPLLDWSKIGKFVGGVVTILLMAYLFWSRDRSSSTYSPSRSISDYLPFSGSTTKPYLYSVPEGPAGSLEALVKRLNTLENAVGRLSADSEAGRKGISALQDGIESEKRRSIKESDNFKSTLTGFSKQLLDLNQAVHDDRIAKIALAAIEEKLPSKLAVRMDSSGKLEIDPKFWNYLREAFAEKKEVASLASAYDKVPAGAKGVEVRQPTWQDFLVENEAALRDWIDTDITSRLGQNAILSKRSFLDILRREIKDLKTEFETKSNENFQQIGEEILSKVAKQEEMKKASLASLINPFTRPQTVSSHTGQQITIKSTDGHNITDIISSLVDSALVKYSKDVLARPDYALGTSGGRVIPSLTSATFQAQPLGLPSKLLGWVTGASSNSGRSPATALHPYNSPGYCWPFAGAQGQLGILLSRRIIPSDVTIEHVSQDVALDGLVASAPRDFELWGIVEGGEDIEKLKEWRDSEMARKRQATEEDGVEDEESEVATSLPLTPQHLLLSSGTYDIASSSPLQTFPVASSARQLGIPVGVVVLKILSNHGEDTYTCLYRVRVGGSSASQSVDASDDNEQMS